MSSSRLAFPFTHKTALAVAVAAAVLGGLPRVGAFFFFGIPPFLFMPIVRGFASGKAQPWLDPPGGTARLIADWWKSALVTAVVLFPIPLLYVTTALQYDVPALGALNTFMVQVSIALVPILACVFPWHLGTLAITDELMFAIFPGAALRVRKERMSMGVIMIAIALFVLGGVFVMLAGGIMMKLQPTVGGFFSRLLWIWLTFQMAILVGESIRKRTPPRAPKP